MGNGEDDADLNSIRLVYRTLCSMNGSATPEGVAGATGLDLSLVEEAIEKLKEWQLIEETTDIGALRYTTVIV